jgi:hypothetical protein
MSNDPKNHDRHLKKDQHAVRDVRDEIENEIHDSAIKPIQRQVNRDRSRGDWDRSGLNHQESGGDGGE